MEDISTTSRPYDVIDMEKDFPEWVVYTEHKRWWIKEYDNLIVLATKGEARIINDKVPLCLPREGGDIPFPQPLNRGGATFIKIVTPDGWFTGVSLCSPHDMFNKRVGRYEAIKDLARKVPALALAVAEREKTISKER